MNKKLKVELVGGPLCGLTQDWPVDTPFMIFNLTKSKYEYEGVREDGVHTAFYRGFAEE
jgi:hypothetical protein